MKPEFSLATPVQFLKSVGPARARALTRLGIATVGDLLAHYPRRYFDRTSCQPIGRARPGQEITVLGEVLTCSDRRTRRGGNLLTVTLGDDTGVVFCVWFNQKFLQQQFKPGRKVMASGVVQFHGGRPQLAHPDFEVLEAPPEGADATPGLHTGRMVPVYGLTAGIGQYWLRGLIDQALTRAEARHAESLPPELVRRHGFPGRGEALRNIHFPADRGALARATARLKYEELFAVQMLMALRRRAHRQEAGIRLDRPGDLTPRLVQGLPFELTGAQRRALKEILADLRSGRPMHRLLQGDVGSGKTLVALIAALFVIEQGHQAVLMAPTEVLARQHGRGVSGLCEQVGVTVETLTGSTPAAQRRAILAGVAAGEIDLLVGTHAVIQDDVRIPRLALAIVDEQHRFGVRQRGASGAAAETGLPAHLLVMSATPIPRSLSLTLYGDLDLSLIDELPAGRQPIETRLVREKDEDDVWEGCRREMAAGRQAYVISPVIEETEGQDLKAATVEFERLRDEVFPEFAVALLHGRLKPREKEAVMDAFARGEVQLLVATTVVEVGVDVPNATAMVIHNPERFGLAQLHQLRGRIGRGRHRSRCWLLCDRYLGEESFARIRFFADHADGFALAEEDLRLRGPGDAWGVRQSGAPGFRLVNPLRDKDLVKVCRDDARAFLAADPDLSSPAGRLIAQALRETCGRALPLQAG
ncbi:ATP-dependent DNA helicase RecG [bacterium]|nr:ATP-dependent DNA helicase RecG [bacterium]